MVALQNGNLLTFNYYPNNLEKVLELNLDLKSSLIKYQKIDKLGDFILKMEHNLLINSFGHLFHFIRHANQTNSSSILHFSKIDTKSPITSLQYLGENKVVLLSHSLQLYFGQIIPKSTRSIKVGDGLKIQKIKLIKKFNFVIVTCYRED
jgi:hypothetical protein